MIVNTDVGDEEYIECVVKFEPVGSQRGYREPPYGVPLEPDIPAHAEIDCVLRKDTGEDITDKLSSEQLDDLADKAINYVIDLAEEAKVEAAIARAEEGRY